MDAELRTELAVVRTHLEALQISMQTVQSTMGTIVDNQNAFTLSVEKRLTIGTERFGQIARRLDEQTADLKALKIDKAEQKDLDKVEGELLTKRTVGGIAGGVSAAITFLAEAARAILAIGGG